MSISQLMKELQVLYDLHGDLPVTHTSISNYMLEWEIDTPDDSMDILDLMDDVPINSADIQQDTSIGFHVNID